MSRHLDDQQPRQQIEGNLRDPATEVTAVSGEAVTPQPPPAPLQRQGPRSRQEVEQERHRVHLETDRNIKQIAAEFHQRLPRDQAKAIGAAYARYSSRFQHSIGDQVRSLFEAALRQGIFIPTDCVFYDLAVRGCKENRPGLNRLRQVLAAKGVQAFLVFTTNRLFRKTYKALRFVEEEVVERGIRCLFVKSGVDSADENRWRMLLQVHAMTDEFVLGMYADNIRAAHEGLLDQQFVFGTISFGYTGQPVAGAKTRRGRPRCRVVIDPETAGWVRRIFTWYVEEQVALGEIVRRLNDAPSIPLGPKSVSGHWTYLAVRKLLANPRYRGCWRYGVTQNVWQSRQDYCRQVPRAEPLREAQFEELRLVSDEQWFAAQARLEQNDRSAAGRKPRDGERRSRPRLLNGLFRCPEHDQILYVGGVHGKYMYCKVCKRLPAAQRPLYSQLPRELALRLTCRALADLVRADPDLIAQVIVACRQEAAQAQQQSPVPLEGLRKRESQLNRQIQFLLHNAGDSDADRLESAASLQRIRRERAEVRAQLSALEAATKQPLPVSPSSIGGELLSRSVSARDGPDRP